jgi:tetratricopeptide (TPR) repeat protein
MRFYIKQYYTIYQSSGRKLLRQVFIMIIFITSLLSCNHFHTVNISRNILQSGNSPKDKYKKNSLFKQYNISAGSDKSYPAHAIKFNLVYYKRYFTKPFSFSPLADINNKGVDLALKGRYAEAEILFSEALKENASFPEASNNLGITYELQNKNESAFTMYTKACMADPDNKFFIRNFLSFCDKKQ